VKIKACCFVSRKDGKIRKGAKKKLMDKNIFYAILSLVMGLLCFLNEIIWKNQLRRTELWFKYYKLIMGVVFIVGGLLILLYKPYK